MEGREITWEEMSGKEKKKTVMASGGVNLAYKGTQVNKMRSEENDHSYGSVHFKSASCSLKCVSAP